MNQTSLTPLEINKVRPALVADLFFSIHYAAILYINSSLLEEYFPIQTVSLLFFLGSAATIVLFWFTPHLLRRFGNKALFFLFVLIEALSTGGLALSHDPRTIAFFFLLSSVMSVMIYFCIDIFIEDASRDESTGQIRGIDLTIANAANLAGPLLLAYFVASNDFSHLYGAATLLLLPLLYLAFFSFREFRDGRPEPQEGRFRSAFSLWWRDGDVKRITISRSFLEFFYAVMVIYVPIHLHAIVGFSWAEIGVMFTVMLVPFLLVELPAGSLADRSWGEKELLLAGFFITGASVLFMPFIDRDFALWTLVLFISRIGAALVEVMTDTYFFKSVNKDDTGLISVYRLARPAAIAGAAVWGIAVLFYTSYAGIYFTLAVACLIGLCQSLFIKDTL